MIRIALDLFSESLQMTKICCESKADRLFLVSATVQGSNARCFVTCSVRLPAALTKILRNLIPLQQLLLEQVLLIKILFTTTVAKRQRKLQDRNRFLLVSDEII